MSLGGTKHSPHDLSRRWASGSVGGCEELAMGVQTPHGFNFRVYVTKVNEKRNKLLKAPISINSSVCMAVASNSMQVDEGRTGRSFLTRDKNACQGKNRSGEEGEPPSLPFVTPDLSCHYYNEWYGTNK